MGDNTPDILIFLEPEGGVVRRGGGGAKHMPKTYSNSCLAIE